MIIFLVLQDDDQNIIAALYESNYKRMSYMAAKILGKHQGEEAVHDAFITLIEKFDKNIADLRDKPALFLS